MNKVGRPPLAKKTVKRTILFDARVWAQLKKLAKKADMNISAVIRLIIAHHLRHDGKNS